MKDKVVIVTGAGRGIGREIAIMMAAHGARVVVNDLGASIEGEGHDAGPARGVVSEIMRSGGEAALSTHSVAEFDAAEAIVQTAIDSFGAVDAVVNNAGNLRDRIFDEMTEKQFISVVQTHLNGAFNVSRAAARHFRTKGRGAFVHMTSTSGLIGSRAQANYGAAKLAIVGLSKSIAIDMASSNVRSNCIAPFAWTRMTNSIPIQTTAQRALLEPIRNVTPKTIASLAVTLCSAECDTNGQIFVVRHNEIFLMSQPRPIRSAHTSEGWTPTSILERAIPAFKTSMYSLDKTSDIFSWDPI